jgi:uncharacterized protein (DUF4415 family)
MGAGIASYTRCEAIHFEQAAACRGAQELVSLRLDAEVIEALESSGPGWRQRVNDILKAALRSDDKVA